MKIKLKKPILHNGGFVHELDIPLENLTGNDLIDVEEQILKTGNPMQTTDFSRVYLISVAARASHMPAEALREMSAHDFAKVTTEVRNFLVVSDSDEDTNENESIQATLPETSLDESR